MSVWTLDYLSVIYIEPHTTSFYVAEPRVYYTIIKLNGNLKLFSLLTKGCVVIPKLEVIQIIFLSQCINTDIQNSSYLRLRLFFVFLQTFSHSIVDKIFTENIGFVLFMLALYVSLLITKLPPIK